MGRISRTIGLAKASWDVLKRDKELIALPLLSLLTTLVVAATFLVPILTAGEEMALDDTGPIGYALMAIAYLVLAFITIFFNTAVVHAAQERMDGGDPTIGSALRGAASMVHRILPWALVSATVSIVLRTIEERAGFVGRIVGAIAGVAWSLVTFLVIPVLVVEDVGVIDAVKRSGRLFKKTWGENVAAQVGFGLLGFLAAIPAMVVVALAFQVGEIAGIVMFAAAVVWMLTVAMVLATLNGIFQTALYRYATGLPAGSFSARELDAAFAPKRHRSGGFGGGITGG